MSHPLRAGGASIVINNDLGTLIQGAGVPDQRVEAIRDDLEANALFLDDGVTRLLLVGCDLVGLETARVRRYTEAMAKAAGLDANAILIGCSHTHGGPVVQFTDHRKPIDETYSQRLQEWLCTLAVRAVEAAVPARLGWGTGHARLGYNRRVCYADGSHSMYRQAGQDDHFTGVEGPDDTASLALAVFDGENRVRAVLHHGTGHPDAFFAGRVLSADYPGLARRLIREAYGPLPVVFFNGALGDIAMRQQAWPQTTVQGREAAVVRFGSTLAGETLRLIHEMRPQAEVTLRHLRTELDLPVRLPDAETVAAGRAVLARCAAGEKVVGREAIFAWGPVALHDQFAEHPFDRLAFHALQIGDLAIATHPFELFCQYQIDLKRRSPARETAWFGLTNGYGGYLPTLPAALGGGYSGVPFAWARFAPEVGHRVVDAVAKLLHDLWKMEEP